jgi:hypothetical protein
LRDGPFVGQNETVLAIACHEVRTRTLVNPGTPVQGGAYRSDEMDHYQAFLAMVRYGMVRYGIDFSAIGNRFA